MDPHGEGNLPDRLVNDLAAVYRAEVRVPADVDRAVTSGARAHFARRGRWVRWVGAGAATAAVLVVTVQLFRSQPMPLTRVAVNASTSMRDGDADGNATVDIRDALALARKVDAGDVAWTRWEDVNRDKVIDRKDVDAIARMAVRLKLEVVR